MPEKKADTDRSIVVFAIDVSGSMCVTSEMPGTGGKKSLLAELEAQARRGGGAPAAEKRYVSRLESVQAAVDAQLVLLKQQHPNRRVALVTFSDDVEMQDGTQQRTVASPHRPWSTRTRFPRATVRPVSFRQSGAGPIPDT